MDNEGKGNAWLLKQTVIYGIAGGIDALAAFILIPIYTHKFSPDVYGTLQMINLFMSIASKFCALGMTNAYLRAYHLLDQYKPSSVLTVAISLQMAAVTLLSVIIFIVTKIPIGISRFTGNFWTGSLVSLFVLSIISSLLVAIGFSHLRAQENASRFTFTAAIGAIINIAGNIFFIYVIELKLEGIIISNIISNLAVTIYIFSKPALSVVSNISEFSSISRHLLSFGLPLVPTGLGLWIIDLADRYVLDFYHGEATVGIYSLGYKYASIISIGITMLHTAWIPTLLRTYRETDRYAFVKFFHISALAGLGMVFLIELLLYVLRKPVISLISGSDYHGAEEVVGPVLLGLFFYAIYYVLTGIAFVEGKNQSILMGSAFGAIFNIGLNVLWVPKYEAQGAAWATCIGYAVFALATYCYIRPFGEKGLLRSRQLSMDGAKTGRR